MLNVKSGAMVLFGKGNRREERSQSAGCIASDEQIGARL
jgi:hypothetical protein